METIPTTGKSVEAYTDEFGVKKNEVPNIMGKPTYTTVKPVLDMVDKILIGMYDERDLLYGKLHLVSNRSQLQGGPPQQVVASTNQG